MLILETRRLNGTCSQRKGGRFGFNEFKGWDQYNEKEKPTKDRNKLIEKNNKF